jgi:hypothetical protein
MAKPRELFNTPAPQAMSQMGAGIAEAYANAGRIQGQGVAAMGESIGKGIQAGVSAYTGYKQMQSQVKSSENFYNTMKEGGYLPPEMTAGIDKTVNSDVYKNMGTAEKAQFWGDVKGYTGNALGQYYKMQQIEAEQKGLFNRAIAAQKPPLDLSGVGAAIDSIWNPKPTGSQTPAAAVPVDQSMQGQDTTQPATDLAKFIRDRLGYIPSVIPPALMAEYNASLGR